MYIYESEVLYPADGFNKHTKTRQELVEGTLGQFDGFVQNCRKSNMSAMESLQCCIVPSKYS